MTDTGIRSGAPDGTCRHCRAEIVWAWLLGERQRVPLDPAPRAPSPDDPLPYVVTRYAVARDHTGRLRARRLDPGERPAPHERPGVSHLAVCPVLVAKRDQRASYRAAKASAPNPYDPEALAEARQERRP